MRLRPRSAALALGLGALLAPLAGPASASPGGEPAGSADGPWVVALGDSYISGEAGRWAGSSNESYERADFLGPTAYFDNPEGTAEVIERCHRSRTAEVHLGGEVRGLNLACSGARTVTGVSDDGYFKPGLDFYDDGAGRMGQAAMLEVFAAEQDVDLVVVSIGGNDFEFGSIVSQCVLNFLTSPEWWKNLCSDDDDIEALVGDAHRKVVRSEIDKGLRNVRAAMRGAGYGDREWTLLVQTYPSPIPNGADFRYGQSGWTRQTVGGCGFWDADADWANETALPAINKTVRQAARRANVQRTKVLDLAHAFDGRRLCERSVGLYEEVGIESWADPAAVDRTEWINQIRITAQDGTLLPAGVEPLAPLADRAGSAADPYYLQESLHPNAWAQLATRSCLRQAYGDGKVRGGRCEIAGTGLVGGEPVMRLR
jgi:hypothetical protein